MAPRSRPRSVTSPPPARSTPTASTCPRSSSRLLSTSTSRRGEPSSRRSRGGSRRSGTTCPRSGGPSSTPCGPDWVPDRGRQREGPFHLGGRGLLASPVVGSSCGRGSRRGVTRVRSYGPDDRDLLRSDAAKFYEEIVAAGGIKHGDP